jgi:hypothetical protein
MLCAGSVARAQEMKRFWVGVMVGAPLTPDIQPSTEPVLPYTGEVKRSLDFPFVAGGMIEFLIRQRFSIEADGLYRRLRYPDDPSVIVTWELPVLLRNTQARVRNDFPNSVFAGGWQN